MFVAVVRFTLIAEVDAHQIDGCTVASYAKFLRLVFEAAAFKPSYAKFLRFVFEAAAFKSSFARSCLHFRSRKATKHTKKSLVSAIQSQVLAIDLDPSRRALCAMPAHHIGGTLITLCWQLVGGFVVDQSAAFDAGLCLEA